MKLLKRGDLEPVRCCARENFERLRNSNSYQVGLSSDPPNIMSRVQNEKVRRCDVVAETVAGCEFGNAQLYRQARAPETGSTCPIYLWRSFRGRRSDKPTSGRGNKASIPARRHELVVKSVTLVVEGTTDFRGFTPKCCEISSEWMKADYIVQGRSTPWNSVVGNSFILTFGFWLDVKCGNRFGQVL